MINPDSARLIRHGAEHVMGRDLNREQRLRAIRRRRQQLDRNRRGSGRLAGPLVTVSSSRVSSKLSAAYRDASDEAGN